MIKIFFLLFSSILIFDIFLSVDLYSQKLGRERGSSVEYRVLLKKGARLKVIKSGESVELVHDIYAMAQKKEFRIDSIYILNNDGDPIFETISMYVIPIESDLDLRIRPLIFKTYDEVKDFFIYDRNFFFEQYVSYYLEVVDASYFAELFPEAESSAVANRIETRSLYSINKSIAFGINLSYLGASIKPSNTEEYEGSYTWRVFGFGPEIRYKWGSYKSYDLYSSISIQQAIIFDWGIDYSFSSNIYQFNFESQHLVEVGAIAFGFCYRKYKISIQGAEPNSSVAGSGDINTYGFYIGYDFNVKI